MEGLTNPWWAFVLLGTAAGLLSGALGVGSGTVLIPGLVLVLLLPQKAAQGTALAVMVPMVLVGAIRYKMNPAIDISTLYVGLLASGAVVGALLGVELAQHLPAALLRKAFAIFIVLVGIRMLWTASGARTPPREDASATPELRLLDSTEGAASDGG